MKKVFKIVIVLIILLLSIELILNHSYVYASEEYKDSETGEGREVEQEYREQREDEMDYQQHRSGDLESAFSQAGSFLNNGREGQGDNNKSEELKNSLDLIFNILVIIGTVLAVIVGGILGIQFMIASAEDKAKVKEALIPYTLGCIVIFGAFAIWKLVVTILNGIA